MKQRSQSYQLFYFATCPYCVIVRVALWWMGIRVELRESLINAANADALVKGGGKLQVPCLRIDQPGAELRWLYESMDIIRYFRNATA